MEKKHACTGQPLTEHSQPSNGNLTSASSRRAPPLDRIPAYLKIKERLSYFDVLGVDNPFCRTHEDLSIDCATVNDLRCINFAGYNYLGLSGHPEVSAAAKAAMARYGTSASGSRVVAGQIPLHLELERGELLKQGILAQLMLSPAVDPSASRLRFMINALQTEAQIRTAIGTVARLIAELHPSPSVERRA